MAQAVTVMSEARQPASLGVLAQHAAYRDLLISGRPVVLFLGRCSLLFQANAEHCTI